MIKIKTITIILLYVLIVSAPLWADRALSEGEIQTLIEKLTSTPRWAWIEQGTINASLQSFNAITNETMVSHETVIYDGNRFYWEITIDDWTVEEKQNAKMVDSPDLQRSKKRIFIWDGQWYSMYFKSTKQAIATKNSPDIQPTITGCLTAGIVPWGYGVYAYDSIMGSDVTAMETGTGEQKQIVLKVKNSTDMELGFLLDCTKDYAVLLSSIKSADGSCIRKEYSNYIEADNTWIPTDILIERYSDCQNENKLVSYGSWTFNNVSAIPPANSVFKPVFQEQTQIEYRAGSTNKPVFCKNSSLIDTRELLNKKLLNAQSSSGSESNCATVAIKYVIDSIGTQISHDSLATLIDDNGRSSLNAMQEYVNDLGLHSLAIRTDVKNLDNILYYKPILYLPQKKHYVVFSHIQDNSVWVIDLTGNNLCYDISLETFEANVDQSVIAFLISDEAIELSDEYIPISQEEMTQTIGSSTGFGKYSCADLIQEYTIQFCQGIGSLCLGKYRIWWNRYGCQEDENGGECEGTGVVGNIFSVCIENPYNPGSCTVTGTWYSQDMRACQK